jgi:hypothetical protein
MKKTLENLLSKLTESGVRIGKATTPGGFYLEIPSMYDSKKGLTIPGKEGARGVIYTLEKSWWVDQYERQFSSGQKLLKLIQDNVPDDWREFNPPSFSDLTKDPKKLPLLYGPQSSTEVN